MREKSIRISDDDHHGTCWFGLIWFGLNVCVIITACRCFDFFSVTKTFAIVWDY